MDIRDSVYRVYLVYLGLFALEAPALETFALEALLGEQKNGHLTSGGARGYGSAS